MRGVSLVVECDGTETVSVVDGETITEFAGRWLAVRLDVQAGATGSVIAWVADDATGKRLWTISADPIPVTDRQGTVARVALGTNGFGDDATEKAGVNVCLGRFPDGRVATLPPVATVADRNDWNRRRRRV